MKLDTGEAGLLKELHRLDVYKLAEELSDLVRHAFDQWPQKAWDTIGHQIIRSSDNIAPNLAEGYGRYTPGDRRIFYRYALGSLEETEA